MIVSKKLNVLTAVLLCISLLLSICLIKVGSTYSNAASNSTAAEYESKLFSTDIISVEIIADESEWQTMLDSATSEQYIMVDVLVGGTKFENVGIRPKGNSSLTQVAQSDSDRYSFRLQFDEYIDGQTCFGLQSLVLNNMIGDNTYMKEYVSYELMNAAGVDAPYFGFANISLNGSTWGLYLAVEPYNDSYEERIFGTTSGMLYNVKSMEMANGEDDNGNMPSVGERPQGDFLERPVYSAAPDSSGDSSSAPDLSPQRGGNMGVGRGGSSGGTLEYSDDSSSSYSAIFENVVGKGNEEDYQRVIEALKALSSGEELERYFDVDQILRYLAAHTVSVNLDSYSSSMAQNYYIYENGGQITILPWDYNLAWGGMQSKDASSVINFPIDTPVSGVEMSARPLLAKLLENEEYMSLYHSYLDTLMREYFENGAFEAKINDLNALISPYVAQDSTAFCTFEEYEAAVSAFKTLGTLRAESIRGQLSGDIPSTTEAQSANPELLVGASEVSLTDLGSMMGGKGNAQGDRSNASENAGADMSVMRQAMEIVRQANGELSQAITDRLTALGLSSEEIGRLTEYGAAATAAKPADGAEQFYSSSSIYIISALLLALAGAILFSMRFKRSY